MKNLIEYLLLLVITILFCPNNYWTIGLCAFIMLIYVVYVLCYIRYRKSSVEIEKTQPFSIELILSLIMIVSANIILDLKGANLIVGYSLAAMFLAILIYNLIKKDTWEKKIITKVSWFDYYSLIYLGFLIMNAIVK